jgi:predicted GNAT family acetyltransferase
MHRQHILDNPVWEALTTEDKRFNIGTPALAYFPEDISPIVGMERWNEDDLASMDSLLPAERSFSIMIARDVMIPPSFEILFTTPLYQMICTSLQPIAQAGATIKQLGEADVPAMLVLTALTKPGPFLQRTIEFGNYIGIYENGELLAMAGERLHLRGYTEVSAVCTHPDHLGKGYAAQLMTYACERIIKQGNIPFLHVKTDNLRAISKYEQLGFTKRADFYFAVVRKRAVSGS